MQALSIRQPWAWLILHAGKDIENRYWPTQVRGRFLIHASKGMTHAEYEEAYNFAQNEAGIIIPSFKALPRGGVVGSVELVNCVTTSSSLWFCGPYGFVLRDPQPLPYLSWLGALGFFDIPYEVMRPTKERAS